MHIRILHCYFHLFPLVLSPQISFLFYLVPVSESHDEVFVL
jgi:hypothetical protein